jgi:hypothetical protein
MADTRLLPCPSCARHVRAFEAACPFCASALPAFPAAAPIARAGGKRLSRAALFALGASAAAIAACSDAGTTQSLYGGPAVDSGQDSPSPAPLYGGAPVDASDDAPVLVDAAYGGPPQDAAADGDASDGGL